MPSNEEPMVIVSDIRMPGMDGIVLLSQIKAQQPNLPVIITTAHSDLDSAVSSYEEGAFEYLPKPFDIDEMVATVNAPNPNAYRLPQRARKRALSEPQTLSVMLPPCRRYSERLAGSRKATSPS